MVLYTVREALAAVTLDRVLVSTNDPRVARLAGRYGAEVPFLRPDTLSADDTPTYPVIRHAIEWVESRGTLVSIVVVLQPTSPLRTAVQIDAAVRLLEDPAVDSAVSVTEIGLAPNVLGVVEDGLFHHLQRADHVRRQVAPAAFKITGGIYVGRRKLLNEGRVIGEAPAALEVEPETATDIDTLEDLREARRLLARRAQARR